MQKVIRFTKEKIALFDEQNRTRKASGLPVMRLVVRQCLFCGKYFESAGRRTCGCRSDKTVAVLSGLEVT